MAGNEMELNVSVNANTAALLKVSQALDEVAKKLDAIGRKSPTATINVDDKKARATIDAFSARMKAQMEAAARSLPNFNVRINSPQIKKDLADIRKEMLALGDKSISFKGNPEVLIRQAEALRQRLEAIQRTNPNIRYTTNIQSALAELTAFDRAAAKDRRINVGVAPAMAEVGALAHLIDRQLGRAVKSIPEINIPTSQAQRDLMALRTRLAALRSKTVGVDIDAPTALAEIAAISTGLEKLQKGADVHIGADAGAALAELKAVDKEAAKRRDIQIGTTKPAAEIGALARLIEDQLSRAVKSIPDIKLPTAGAQANLIRLRAELESLRGKTVGVDIDAPTMMASLARIKGQLESLRDLKGAINMQISADAGSAFMTIDAIEKEIKKRRELEIGTGKAKAQIGALAETLQRELGRAAKSLPEIQFATGRAQNEINSVRVALESLSGKTIGVDIDAGTALAEVAALKARLETLRKSPDIQISADAGAAFAVVEALEKEIKKRRDIDLDVKIEDGALGARMRAAAERAYKAIPDYPLTLSTTQAELDMRRLRAYLEKMRNFEIGVNISGDGARKSIEGLRQDLETLSKHSDFRIAADATSALRSLDEFDREFKKSREVKVDTTRARADMGAFARDIQDKLKKATESIQARPLNFVSTGSDAQLTRLRAEMDALGKKRIGIDIDADAALAEIATLRAELEAVSKDRKANIQVRAEAVAALAQLAAVESSVRKLDGKTINIKTEGISSSLRKLASSFFDSLSGLARFSRNLSTLAVPASLASGTSTIIAIGAAAAQAAQSLLLIPAALTAAAAGVGALISGFHGMGAVFKESASAEDTAAQKSLTAANKRTAAAERIKNAQESLADAQRQADRASISGAEQVADARQSLANAQVSAAERIKDAEQSLADAVSNSAQSIADAQQSASRTAASVARSIADARTALADAEASAADRIANAEQNLARTIESVNDRIADARENLTEAMENSAERITEAEDRLQETIENNAERIADAQENLTEAIADSADRISDAQLRLADVIEESADRVTKAEKDLADSQKDAADAQKDLNQARKDAADDIEDLQLQLSGLALDEEQATLRVKEAQIELARQARKAGGTTSLAYAQAELAVRQAQQTLLETKEKHQDVAAAAQDAAEKGVEGSDKVVSAQEKLAEANQKVIDQEKDLAKTRRDAAKDVADAEKALSDARVDGAKRVADAEKALAKTQKDAQKDLLDAQKALSDARVDGAKAVTKAEKALADAQKDGARQIADAQKALNDARTDGAKSVADAEKRLQQAQLDGAQQIADANERVRRAQVEGARQVSDAEEALRRARRDGNQEVADAQKSLDRAIRDSAQANEDAARAVTRAMDDLKAAMSKSTDGSVEGIDKVKAAMDKLSPAAKEVVQAILDMKASWKDLQQATSEAMWTGIATKVRELGANYLPILKDTFVAIGGSVNRAMKEVADFFNRFDVVDDVRTQMGNVTKAVDIFAGSFKPLASIWNDLATVGSEFLPSLAQAFTNTANKVADFITKARDSGQLKVWIGEGIQAMHDLIDITTNVGSIIASMFRASREAGYDFLGTVKQLTGELRTFFNSGEGQAALLGFFRSMKQSSDALLPGIKALVTNIGDGLSKAHPAIVALATAFADVATRLAPTIPMLAQVASDILPLMGSGLGLILKVLGPLAPLLITMVTTWKTFAALGSKFLIPLGNSLATAALSAGTFTEKIGAGTSAADKFSAAGTKIADTGGKVQSFLSKASSALPIVGLAVIALSEVYDAFMPKPQEAAQKVVDGSESMLQSTKELADQIDKNGIDILGGADAAQAYALATKEMRDRTEEMIKTLPQHEQAQKRANIALGDYKYLQSQGKGETAEATAKLNEYHYWTDEAKRSTEVFGEKIKDATEKMKDQQNQIRSQIDADFAWQDALDRIGESQDRLAEVVAKSGANSREAHQAERDLAKAYLDAADAARRKSEESTKAATGVVDEKAANDAYIQTLLSFSRTATGPAKEAIDKLLAGYDQTELAALSAGNATSGLATKVVELPGGKEINVLVDPKQAVEGLDQIGAKLKAAAPDQKVINVGALTEKAFTALEQLGVKVDRLKDGTVQVTVDDALGRKKLEAFVAFSETLKALPKIDINTLPAEAKAGELKKGIDGLVAMMKADANIAPGTERAKMLQDKIGAIEAFMSANANIQPGSAKAAELQKMVNDAVAFMQMDGDNTLGTEKGNLLADLVNNRLKPFMKIDADATQGEAKARALVQYVGLAKPQMIIGADGKQVTLTSDTIAQYIRDKKPIMVMGADGKPAEITADAAANYSAGKKPIFIIGSDGKPSEIEADSVERYAREKRPMFAINAEGKLAKISADDAERYSRERKPTFPIAANNNYGPGSATDATNRAVDNANRARGNMQVGAGWQGVIDAVKAALNWVRGVAANIGISITGFSAGGIGVPMAGGGLSLPIYPNIMPMKDGGLIQAMADGARPSQFMGHRLSPMAAGEPKVVQPNAWRVIGDRNDVPESYIPWKKSDSTTKLLAITAAALDHRITPIDRSGRHVEGMAMGGISTLSNIAPSVRSDLNAMIAAIRSDVDTRIQALSNTVNTSVDQGNTDLASQIQSAVGQFAAALAQKTATPASTGMTDYASLANDIRSALRDGLAEAMNNARVIENNNQFTVADGADAADKFASRLRAIASLGALNA